MLLKCTRCGGDIDAEQGLCLVCGFRLGESLTPVPPPSPPAAPQIELDDPSTRPAFGATVASVDDNVWGDADDDISQVHPSAGAVASMERALELTGITDAGRSMARIVPRLRPKVELAAAALTPFEAYLLSLVDGQTSVHDIMAMSGLTLFEAVTAVTSLHDKGMLDIEETLASNEPLSQKSPSSSSAIGKLDLKRKTVSRARAPRVDESDPDVLLDKADDAIKEGNLHRATEFARLALVQAPNSERALQLKQTLANPGMAQHRAEVMAGLGVQAYLKKNYALAVQMLNASLDEFEPQASVHHRLGLAMARLNIDLVASLTHLRRAVDLAPDNAKYQRNLKRVESHLKTFEVH